MTLRTQHRQLSWTSVAGNARASAWAILFVLGAVTLFLAMHASSVSYVPGNLLASWLGWNAAIEGVVSAERIGAPRFSALGAQNVAVFTSALILMAVGYLLALRRASRGELRGRHIAIVAALASVFLVVTPRLLSSDVFNYIAYARAVVVYGANPYVVPPAQLGDQVLEWMTVHTHVCSPYGPAWIGLSSLWSAMWGLGTSSVPAAVIGFRILALALHAVNAGLIWRLAGSRRALATVAYALNPLVLIELGVSAHNEVLVVTWLLLAVVMHRKGLWSVAALCLAGAALTKVTALPALGLYGVYWLWATPRWSRGVLRAVAVGSVAAAAAAVAYAPFWAGWDTFAFAGDNAAASVRNSLAESIVFGAADAGALPGGSVRTLARWCAWVGLGITGLACMVIAWRARRGEPPEAMWRSFFYVWVTVGAGWFWPWYVIPVVALSAVSGRRREQGFALLLSLSVLLFYVAEFSGIGGRAAPDWLRMVYAHRAWLVLGLPVVWWLVTARRVEGTACLASR